MPPPERADVLCQSAGQLTVTHSVDKELKAQPGPEDQGSFYSSKELRHWLI